MGDFIVTVTPCNVTWTGANNQIVYCVLPPNHQTAVNQQVCPVHRSVVGQESK